MSSGATTPLAVSGACSVVDTRPARALQGHLPTVLVNPLVIWGRYPGACAEDWHSMSPTRLSRSSCGFHSPSGDGVVEPADRRMPPPSRHALRRLTGGQAPRLNVKRYPRAVPTPFSGPY